MPLKLTEATERDVLPSSTSLDAFLKTERASYEHLVSDWRPASAWYERTIAGCGGDCVPDWWSDDPIIKCNSFLFYRVGPAYYFPRFGAVISQSGELFQSTVHQAKYQRSEPTFLPGVSGTNGTFYFDPPSNISRLAQAAVTMPWGALHNYGHFVLDCLPALASMAEAGLLSHYSAVFPLLQPWQDQHIHLVGVDAHELRDDVYLVDDVVFSSAMAGLLHYPNTSYLTLRQRQLDRLPPHDGGSRALYIVRPPRLKRSFRSDTRLQSQLHAVGFQLTSPEEHSVDEQIALFNRADIVVGCAGAAFANALYCKPGAQIVEIIPLRMVLERIASGVWVYNICALVGCGWRPYFCANSWDDPHTPAGLRNRPELDFSFDADPDDLLQYIA